MTVTSYNQLTPEYIFRTPGFKSYLSVVALISPTKLHPGGAIFPTIPRLWCKLQRPENAKKHRFRRQLPNCHAGQAEYRRATRTSTRYSRPSCMAAIAASRNHQAYVF